MIIKDWWYAVKVCRKYGIKWNPFRKLDNASFWVKWDDNNILTEKRIHMSPFYPHFLETFMHEIGHIVLYKRGVGQRMYISGQMKIDSEHEVLIYHGRHFLSRLEEESLASRFARKAMKGRANVKDLVKAFQTYSAWGYSTLMRNIPENADLITNLTNAVEKGLRRIEK